MSKDFPMSDLPMRRCGNRHSAISCHLCYEVKCPLCGSTLVAGEMGVHTECSQREQAYADWVSEQQAALVEARNEQ